MLSFRTYQIIMHIAGWLLFMAFPILFINAGQYGNVHLLLNSPYYWAFCFTYIFLFYLNAYVLIPRFFLTKKYVWYAIISLSLFAGVFLLKPYDRLLRNTDTVFSFPLREQPMQEILTGRHMPPPPGFTPVALPDNGRTNLQGQPFRPGTNYPLNRRPFDSVSFFIFLMIMALSTAIRIILQWQKTEQRAAIAETDKARAELAFLKAQINPHFLFNTLNNIYTLAVIKDEHAPDSVMKLSNIMRYVTDDASEDFVPLQNEIDCINDYIGLQRLRLGEKTHVDLIITGDVLNKQIAPLILMTFIENVFKYGVSKHHESTIFIKIWCGQENISFYCQNSIFPEKTDSKREGIGLKNTAMRLEHLYPGKHLLDIYTESQLYTVSLQLQTT